MVRDSSMIFVGRGFSHDKKRRVSAIHFAVPVPRAFNLRQPSRGRQSTASLLLSLLPHLLEYLFRP
jgi:hypothetical protein